MYSQMAYQIRQRLTPHRLEDTRAESTKWCETNKVATAEAVRRITGKEIGEPLYQIQKEVFKHAEEVVANLPVKMGGGADLDLLYYLTSNSESRIVVETGVAHGWSSLALLLALRGREGSFLYSTDMPYPKMGNEQFVGCVVPESLRSQWRIVRLPDRQALPEILETAAEIDLCHYDSDKSYRGRMWAYPRLWKSLRVGGIFVSDDINDNLAFKHFAERVGSEALIVFHEPEQKYIGILKKTT